MSEAGRFLARASSLLSDHDGIHPYKAKFWKAYLGEAYALWELVRLRSSRKGGWSTVQTYQVKDLAAELKAGPEDLVTWMDRLSREQVMVIEVLDEGSDITVVKVQVWHDLTILTPRQAGQLSPELQAEHAAWLKENLRRLGLDELN